MRHLAMTALLLASVPAAGPTWAQASGGTTTADEEEEVLIDVGEAGEDRRPKQKVPPTYSMTGITRAAVDFSGIDAAWNLHAIQGIRIPNLNWLSVEIDVSVTLIPGENQNQQGGGGFFGGPSQSGDDFGLQSIGLFAAVKSPGSVYGSARYGFRYLQSSLDDLNQEQSGEAWSIGAGYRWTDGAAIELMYSEMADGLDYNTALFQFDWGS